MKSSTLSSSQWRDLETLIEKIMANCLGQALYERLIAEGKSFYINVNGNLGQRGTFIGDWITLGGLDRFDDRLFHELWHGYQKGNGEDFSVKDMNLEIEAHLAQYLYYLRHPDYGDEEFYSTNFFEDNARGRAIKDLSNLFYLDGTFNSDLFSMSDLNDRLGSVANVFRRNGYHDYIFDESRNGVNTFRNLEQLQNDCPQW